MGKSPAKTTGSLALLLLTAASTSAFAPPSQLQTQRYQGPSFVVTTARTASALAPTLLQSSSTSSTTAEPKQTSSGDNNDGDNDVMDYNVPEDAVIVIKPKAMNRLRELRKSEIGGDYLILRMGVRSGGCSGMSYAMDFAKAEDISDDDAVDVYEAEGIKCVVDAKSMLYLYGLELDFSDALVGGGFKFFNPNAEESCGCGSSFGV